MSTNDNYCLCCSMMYQVRSINSGSGTMKDIPITTYCCDAPYNNAWRRGVRCISACSYCKPTVSCRPVLGSSAKLPCTHVYREKSTTGSVHRSARLASNALYIPLSLIACCKNDPRKASCNYFTNRAGPLIEESPKKTFSPEVWRE